MPSRLRVGVLVAGVGALVATALPAAATAAHPARKTACFGKQPTIFSSKNGVTLKGTKHADVIEATGKNVTVSGGGGNDRICVKGAKKVDGGAGDDQIQLVSGSVTGGTGKDTVKVLAGAGTVKIDGGAGPNAFSVPSSRLPSTLISFHSGDTLNGVGTRVDAPAGAPSFGLEYYYVAGPRVLFDRGVQYNSFSPGSYPYLYIYNALAANGRTLVHWSVDFGDGSPVLQGAGGPPGQLGHSYITTGAHLIRVTVTDNLGASTTNTQIVDVANYSDVALAETSGNPATSPNKAFTITTTPGANSHITSWYLSFGDGASTGGPGAPPASAVAHTYATQGVFRPEVTIVDDHGDSESDSISTTYATAANVAMSDLRVREYQLSPAFVSDPSVDVAVPNGASVRDDNEVIVTDEVVGGFQSRTVDWGDGTVNSSSYHYYRTGAPVTRTVTITYRLANGTTLPAVTRTFQVLPQDARAVLATSKSQVVEGPVTFSTVGTVLPAGSVWSVYWGDGSVPEVGNGPLPATLTHVFAAGSYTPDIEVEAPDGSYDESYGNATSLTVTSIQPRIFYFGGGGSYTGSWVPTTAVPDASGDPNLSFSGSIIPATGSRTASATIDFGDHTATAVPNIGDNAFGNDEVVHGYTVPGDYVALLTSRDANHRVALDTDTISVAGPMAATLPSTGTGVHGTAIPLPLTGVSGGANATLLGYDVAWGDSATPANPDSFGYGAPPALSHTYTLAGTYQVSVTLFNDHGAQIVRRLTLTVT